MVPRTLAILGGTSTLKIPTTTFKRSCHLNDGTTNCTPCRITLPGSKFSTQLEGAPLVANGLTMLFNYPAFSSPLTQNSMCHTRNVDCLPFPMMCSGDYCANTAIARNFRVTKCCIVCVSQLLACAYILFLQIQSE